MERIVTIERVLTKRSFTTDKGTFTTQPLLLKEVEERQLLNGQIVKTEHTYIAELVGQKADEFNLGVGVPIKVGLTFSARNSQAKPDQYFQSVRITYISTQV